MLTLEHEHGAARDIHIIFAPAFPAAILAVIAADTSASA
jgi:hypothetical protein